VTPIYAASAAASLGPTGAPTAASTDTIGGSTATCALDERRRDVSPTRVEYRLQGGSTYTTRNDGRCGCLELHVYRICRTSPRTNGGGAHEGRSLSSYLGPSVDTQFTTLSSLDDALLPPTNVSLAFFSTGGQPADPTNTLTAYWTNSGESGVETAMSSSRRTPASPTCCNRPREWRGQCRYEHHGQRVRIGCGCSTRRAAAAPSAYTTPVSITVTAF
jgi:hypothetical protein